MRSLSVFSLSSVMIKTYILFRLRFLLCLYRAILIGIRSLEGPIMLKHRYTDSLLMFYTAGLIKKEREQSLKMQSRATVSSSESWLQPLGL